MLIPWAIAPMFLITDIPQQYSGWAVFRVRTEGNEGTQFARFATTNLTKVHEGNHGQQSQRTPPDALAGTFTSPLRQSPKATKVREPFEDVEILCECLKLIGCAGLLRRDKVASQNSMFQRSFRFAILALLFSIFPDVVVLGGFSVRALGQQPPGSWSSAGRKAEDRSSDRRDNLSWNWNQRGRRVPSGESAAKLRFRAYRQKMAMRTARAAYANAMAAVYSRAPEGFAFGLPETSTPWVSVGPAPLASDATGDGEQDYNWVSGRATSVVIDPSDTSGNTVLLGGALMAACGSRQTPGA